VSPRHLDTPWILSGEVIHFIDTFTRKLQQILRQITETEDHEGQLQGEAEEGRSYFIALYNDFGRLREECSGESLKTFDDRNPERRSALNIGVERCPLSTP
jgi:hypothetical protein